MHNKQITLTELIDVRTLQKIQDAFSNATGMAALTVDLDGPVTELSNGTDFCMRLTRGCVKGAERCNKCDLQGGDEAGRTGRPSVYYCHGGLMDFAAPILLEGRQVGSLIGGQVLPEPADENKFIRIAKEIGVNPEEYVREVRKIKVMPKKNIEASAALLYTIANSLSEMGHQKHQSAQTALTIKELTSELYMEIEKISENIKQIESKNRELAISMSDLGVVTGDSKAEVEKTKKIVKYINDVSMQTKLLGFNASVEAARANTYGVGFAVIAEEIRKLADDSKLQFNEIEKIINTIKNGVLDIDQKIENANINVQTNTNMLQIMRDNISVITINAKKLEEVGNKL